MDRNMKVIEMQIIIDILPLLATSPIQFLKRIGSVMGKGNKC